MNINNLQKEETKWSKEDLEKLVELINMFGLFQWEKISANMEKDVLDCQEFYTFLMGCANRLFMDRKDDSESEDEIPMMLSNDILQNKPIKDKKKEKT